MIRIRVGSAGFVAAFVMLVSGGWAAGDVAHRPAPVATADVNSTSTANIAADSWIAANVKMTKHFDAPSSTTYYLTRIKHRDADGKLIKLHMEISNKPKGETVRAFARRRGSMVAINASMGLSNLPDHHKQPVGIQIIDGVIKQELSKKSYTLGIKSDNELVAYAPGTSATAMLKDGAITALTAFIPLVLDHVVTTIEIYKNNSQDKHPRQVVAQYDNKDILFLSCGGRGYDGEGMTADDLRRVMKALDVKFAFNLDGGGSVSTIIGRKNINKKIDGKGTLERARPNFLYVTKD